MVSNSATLTEIFDSTCTQSAVGTEYTIHQIAPYIGKIKSSIAKFLIQNFTEVDDIIFDPFCGAGTIPFEGWALGRSVIANDLNSYAVILTKAKLFPPKDLDFLVNEIEHLDGLVHSRVTSIDTSNVPTWVSNFFHPETLKEIIIWVELLKEKQSWFVLSCLLGILHHQRPGFLSYPSSHTVPYLRSKKFPKDEYPTLYEYRNVKERLLRKVKRAFVRHPKLNYSLEREVYKKDAADCDIKVLVDAIITSPPYMRQLDYARDNRLRLWFLGEQDHKSLDQTISPKESDFIETIRTCLIDWNRIIKPGGKCILFLGDNYSRRLKLTLPDLMERMFYNDLGNYKMVYKHESKIPNNRRVRRSYTGNKSESILVFQKDR